MKNPIAIRIRGLKVEPETTAALIKGLVDLFSEVRDGALAFEPLFKQATSVLSTCLVSD